MASWSPMPPSRIQIHLRPTVGTGALGRLLVENDHGSAAVDVALADLDDLVDMLEITRAELRRRQRMLDDVFGSSPP